MSKGSVSTVSQTAEQMRRTFDEAFAVPPAPARREETRYLAVRVGGATYGIPMGELAGIYHQRKVVAVPGGHGAMLGIAGIQGRLVAVYSLAKLLGVAEEPSSWLAVCQGASGLALGVVGMEGQFSAPAEALHAPAEGMAHLAGSLRRGAGVVHVLNLASIIQRIHEEIGSAR